MRGGRRSADMKGNYRVLPPFESRKSAVKTPHVAKHAPVDPVADRPKKSAPAGSKHRDTDRPRFGGIAAVVAASVGAASKAQGTKRVPKDSLTGEAAKLRDLAVSTRKGHTWNPADNDLTKGKNAHRSNTPAEMEDALKGDHNWLEGDLRVGKDGKPVLSHDADKIDQGLSLDEWLKIGGASERGLKIDVKEDDAIPQLLDALEKSGIPDGRIMLNVGKVPESQIKEMRERFPDAWIALTPKSHEDGFHQSDLDEYARLADAAGGRIAFPLRWDIASDKAIATLKPHGKVSIWTSASQGTPDDTAAERKRLIDRGVDGVIDLAPPQGLVDKLMVHGLDLWESGPVRGTREFVGDAKDGVVTTYNAGKDVVSDAAETAVNVTKSGVNMAREGASHIPVIGGLFD